MSFSNDPFYAAKNDLECDIDKVKTKITKWKNAGLQEESNRLFKEITQQDFPRVEQLINKLEETLKTAESEVLTNYGMKEEERKSRWNFIVTYRNQLEAMGTNVIKNMEAQRNIQQQHEMEKLHTTSAPSSVVHQQTMKKLEEERDDKVDATYKIVQKNKYVALEISRSVQQQNEALNSILDDTQTLNQNVSVAKKRLDYIINTANDNKSWVAIVVLFILLVALIVGAFLKPK